MSQNRKVAVLLAAVSVAVLSSCDNDARQRLETQRAMTARLLAENENLKQRVVALEADLQRLADAVRNGGGTVVIGGASGDGGATTASATTAGSAPAASAPASAAAGAGARPAAGKTRAASDRGAAAPPEPPASPSSGFRSLKPASRFETTGLTIDVSPPQFTRRWSFAAFPGRSRYRDGARDSDDGERGTTRGDESRYRDVTRGNRLVVAQVTITADKTQKNPQLPGFAAYGLDGDKLVRLGNAGYEFVRWRSRDAYYGRAADFGNDFAYTATIPFSIGVEVPEEAIDKPLFLIASRRGCFTRSQGNPDPPPMSYWGGCSDVLKDELTLAQVSSSHYFVVKIWNAGKL